MSPNYALTFAFHKKNEFLPHEFRHLDYIRCTDIHRLSDWDNIVAGALSRADDLEFITQYVAPWWKADNAAMGKSRALSEEISGAS